MILKSSVKMSTVVGRTNYVTIQLKMQCYSNLWMVQDVLFIKFSELIFLETQFQCINVLFYSYSYLKNFTFIFVTYLSMQIRCLSIIFLIAPSIKDIVHIIKQKIYLIRIHTIYLR